MGIAVGDFDRSGTPDIHVTNFYEEAACVYLNEGGIFRDRNVKYKLEESVGRFSVSALKRLIIPTMVGLISSLPTGTSKT